MVRSTLIMRVIFSISYFALILFLFFSFILQCTTVARSGTVRKATSTRMAVARGKETATMTRTGKEMTTARMAEEGIRNKDGGRARMA